MKSKKELFLKRKNQLYCFADHPDLCKKLLEGGARIIQFRNKNADNDIFYITTKEMLSLVRLYEDAVLIINDQVDIAMEIKADGIHIGQNDSSYSNIIQQAPEDMIIGVSVDNEKEAMMLKRQGPLT